MKHAWAGEWALEKEKEWTLVKWVGLREHGRKLRTLQNPKNAPVDSAACARRVSVPQISVVRIVRLLDTNIGE